MASRLLQQVEISSSIAFAHWEHDSAPATNRSWADDAASINKSGGHAAWMSVRIENTRDIQFVFANTLFGDAAD
jgi:hypothetical protein